MAESFGLDSVSVGFGIVVGFVGLVPRPLPARRALHRRSERAGGEDRLRARAAARRRRRRSTIRSPQALRPDERERYALSAGARDPAGRPVLQVAVGDASTRCRSPPTTAEHGVRSRRRRSANSGGTMLEAVTKDQLNTGLTGQIRYRVSERNLYAYLFGVKNPIAHVMGYFVSILRERIANFEAPPRRDRRRGARAASRPTRRSSAASRSTTCARTCATSTSTWTASAGRRRRATASCSTRR